ncbi:MAG: VOC family protein [Pseudomonadota bacterium]
MSTTPKRTTATVTPSLRYNDAPKAIEWLCAVFGFEKHLIVPGENNSIRHAQLSFGNGMIMLASSSVENEYGKLVVQPEDIGGRQTQTISLVVNDADEVYRRVKQAGTPILIDLYDAEYGGRGFTCRDLEGHVWNIGTYDPWQAS